MPRILGPKSFVAGLAFVGIALILGASAAALDPGTPARMGPGFFPLLAASILGLLGVMVCAEGLLRAEEPPAIKGARGFLMVGASALAFAASVESLGLVFAVAATSFLLSLADGAFRLLPALATAAALAAFSWIVFVKGLAMPWPAFGYLLQ